MSRVTERQVWKWVEEERQEGLAAKTDQDRLDAIFDALGLLAMGLQLYTPAEVEQGAHDYIASQKARNRPSLPHQRIVTEIAAHTASQVRTPEWMRENDVHAIVTAKSIRKQWLTIGSVGELPNERVYRPAPDHAKYIWAVPGRDLIIISQVDMRSASCVGTGVSLLTHADLNVKSLGWGAEAQDLPELTYEAYLTAVKQVDDYIVALAQLL